MTTEAEIRVMGPQKCHQPPEAGGSKERFSPRASRGTAAMILDLWPLKLWQDKFLLCKAIYFVLIC